MTPAALLLLALGCYLCRETFVRVYTAHMNSMHGFWIALARLGEWSGSQWWPYWDAGMPFEFTYPPLIPGLAAVIGFHAVSGLVFCTGPVSLFWLAARWGGSVGYGLTAAAVWIFTSPSQWIVPDAKFAWRHLWDARRIYTMFVWDETPHYAALALLPVALLAIDRTVRTGSRAAFACSCVAAAAMLLASAFGATMLAMAWIAYAPVRGGRAWWTLPLAGFAGALLAAPWLPLSWWLAVVRNAQAMPESRWTPESWVALGVAAAGWAALYLLSRRAEIVLRFALLFAWLTGAAAAMYRYLGWHFLPQPGRYLIEFDWAMAIVAVFAVRPLIRLSPPWARAAAVAALVAAAFPRVIEHRRYLKTFLAEKPVAETIEYRAAQWLEENLPGRRAMLAGSMAQWANAFSRTPQFRGGSYPAAYNPAQQRASEAVVWASEADWETGVAWMKAFAVEAVAVAGKESPEFWKPYPHPEAFAKLPLLWKERDTAIYETGAGGLARVAPEAAFAKRPDAEEVRRFAAALRPAQFEWLGPNRARVRAEAGVGEAISIAVNYHPGWTARVDGREAEVSPDGLGLMRVAAHGNVTVELEYDGGPEAVAMRWVSGVAALAIGFAVFAKSANSP